MVKCTGQYKGSPFAKGGLCSTHCVLPFTKLLQTIRYRRFSVESRHNRRNCLLIRVKIVYIRGNYILFYERDYHFRVLCFIMEPNDSRGGISMRIAVCDDCAEDALTLQRYLAGHELSVYSNAESLLADVEEKKIQHDLYLLDIFIGDSMNGIELARRLRNNREEAVICFISSSNDFYREAYDVYAFQYLLKPVQEEALNRLLDKVQRIIYRNAEKKLVYSWWGKSGAIPYGRILYISSRGHSLHIRCTDGSIQETTGKLADLDRQVCGDQLMRCHQSFIVNMYHVEQISGTNLLIGGEWIPVSRRYCDSIRKRYREILFEEVE